jgi:hypothetical protein
MVILLVLQVACDADRSGPPDLHPVDTDDRTVDSAPDDSAADDTAPDDTAPDDTAPDDTGPPPHDADGDGHDAPAYGGDDCDDADAWTYPGAEEWCDPIDHDCNGDPLEEGVCGKVQSGEAVLRPLFTATADVSLLSGAALVSDVSGDGLGDLLVACWAGCPPAGTSYLAYAGWLFPTTIEEVGRDPAKVWAERGADYIGDDPPDAGDVDGDGIVDVAFPVHGEYTSGLKVFHGPIILDGTTVSLNAADEFYTSSQNYESWGYPIVGGADFDGDGRSDFAGDTWQTGYDVFFGGSGDVVRLAWDGEARGMTNLGDLDGDGFDDLYFQLAWVSGAELRGADGAHVTDLASGTWNVDTRLAFREGAWAGIGDWDGDGLPEVAAGAYNSSSTEEQQGEVYIFGAGLSRELTLDDSLGSIVGGGATQGLGYKVIGRDIDDDGTADLLADAGYIKRWYLLPASHGIPPLRTAIDEIALAYDGVTSARAGPDFTGDGNDDWMAVGRDSSRIGIIPGWSIPWDDPRYW